MQAETTMGKVLVSVKIENLSDLYAADRGTIPAEDVRFVEADDALVDTGATSLNMPTRMIAALGLKPVRTRQANTAAGIVTVTTFGAVRLTIQDRDCFTDVTEVPDTCPILVGQIPLEAMDWVVDMPNRRLTGNPAHGGEHMIDIYSAIDQDSD